MAPTHASAEPHQELDRLLKTVMALDQGRVLPWVFRPELCQMLHLPACRPLLISQLDKEFSDVRRLGDYLLELMFSVASRAAHLEFQKHPERRMGRRMARYQVAIRLKHDLEMFSIVLNTFPPRHTQVFQAERFILGPRSEIGWINVSVPLLVPLWPDETDSPMAEILRALVAQNLDRSELRSLLVRLRGMGLTGDDCRHMLLMLSFLLSRRDTDDRHPQHLVDEVFAMIELEDSFLYEICYQRAREKALDEGKRLGLDKGKRLGLDKGKRLGLDKGKRLGLIEALLALLEERGIALSAQERARVLSCRDLDLLRRWLRRAAQASSAPDLFLDP